MMKAIDIITIGKPITLLAASKTKRIAIPPTTISTPFIRPCLITISLKKMTTYKQQAPASNPSIQSNG